MNPFARFDAAIRAARQIPRPVWERTVCWLLLAASVLFAAATPLWWAKRAWMAPDSPLAFQPLVPLAALVLWGDALPRIKAEYRETVLIFSPHSPKLRGNVLLLAASAILLMASFLTQAAGLGVLGAVIACAGCVEFLWGKRIRNACLAPLCFLLWMVPPPDSVVARATQSLQVACTAMAGQFLRWLHVPCLVSGNVIMAGRFRLEIVGACSGMSILFPLLCLTVWLMLRARQKTGTLTKIALLMTSGSVAVLLNVLRITLMGVLGAKAPELVARLHDASGWLFTLAGFAIVYFLADKYDLAPQTVETPSELAAPTPHEVRSEAEALSEAQQLVRIAVLSVPRRAVRLIAFFGLLGVLGLWQQARMTNAGTWIFSLPHRVLMAGTTQSASDTDADAPERFYWESQASPIAQNSLLILGGPRADARTYRSPFGETVSVSVVSAGSFDAYHEPAVCLLGSGWVASAEREMPIFPNASPNAAPMRAMIFRNDTLHSRILMLYWLQDKTGETRTDRLMGTYRDWQARLQTGLQTLCSNRQTCIVRVIVPLDAAQAASFQARRNAEEIARAVYSAGVSGKYKNPGF